MRHTHRTHAGPVRRRSRRLLSAAATLVLASLVAVAPVGARPSQEEPAGGIGLRLLDAPLATKDDPRARIYIVDHLAPGAVIERRIAVTNTTTVEHDIALYPAAASIEDGTFVGASGRTLNDLASWTSVGPSTVAVPAGGRATALVTIAVPADAAPGEQYGAVWAEARSSDSEGGVAQVSRVGIRLYVSVGPGGAPAADFTIDSLTAERTAGGDPMVSAIVHNTGGRALDMEGTLKLRNGPGGLTAGPYPAELGSTLAIGDARAVRIELDERLPDGPWEAVVTLNSGLTERRAEATLTFPHSGAAGAVEVSPLGSDLPPTLLLAVTGGFAGLLAIALVVRRRHRSRRWRPAHAVGRPRRAI